MLIAVKWLLALGMMGGSQSGDLLVGSQSGMSIPNASQPPMALTSPTETAASNELWDLTLRVTPESPRLSDSIRLELEVKLKKPLQLENPVLSSWEGAFEWSLPSAPLTAWDSSSGLSTSTYVFWLSPRKSGNVPLPTIAIPYAEKGGTNPNRGLLVTPERSIEILSQETDSSAGLIDLPPIHGPLEVSQRTPRVLPTIVLVLLTLGLVSALVWVALRKKRRVEQLESAEQAAEREMNSLLNSTSVAEKQRKDFYVRLTHVVRTYIKRKTGWNAPDLTTEEFLTCLKSEPKMDANLASRILEFLETADLIKFAGQLPDENAVEKTIAQARYLVQSTTWASLAIQGGNSSEENSGVVNEQLDAPKRSMEESR